ncbi:rhomboid family intramembrane serine protease [Porphyromonas loveana]|uniref:rhomboid family intramembrane serine protease n=1 Tax=Porphyromonas loveana TaxID=1884669 RepID=UPI0035A139CE
MFKSIPSVTRNLLLINIIVFMLQIVVMQRADGSDLLTEVFGLHFYKAEDFRIWQLVTYMFLHGSWTHVLLNMLSLWMFGGIIERTMGTRRFLTYYLICGIGAGLCQEVWQLGEYYITGYHLYQGVSTEYGVIPMGDFLNQWVTIGASGACYGVLLAYGMTFPDERVMLLIPPIPMKAKYFVLVYAAIELYSAFASNGNVAHFAHLGGMLFGWLYFRHCRRQQQAAQSWGAYGRTVSEGGGGTLQHIRRTVEQWGAAAERFVTSLFGNSPSRPSRKEPRGGNGSSSSYSNPDHAYNAQRRAQQERIDAILDKVRRSGYASLTEEEKRELFNNSHRR